MFKSRSSFGPFMPAYQGKLKTEAGYYQPGEEVNYIALTAELYDTNPYSTIVHEYVHSLTEDTARGMPLWFSEGLAEFYSTFEVFDSDKKVRLGRPIAEHVYLLRDNRLLPLATLFAVGHDSPHYNENEKMSIFYAQSWALTHYFMFGNQQQRRPQFIKFLSLLLTDAPVEESFRQAFQTDYATIEKELKKYIGNSTYSVEEVTFGAKLEIDSGTENSPMTEAEWNYYLGDLLLHMRRTDAETYPQRPGRSTRSWPGRAPRWVSCA